MLFNEQSNEEVPLKGIKVVGNLMDAIAQVTMEQVYHNTGESAIEAVFKFPLDKMSAVCGCEATINGATIVAQVKEKQAAKEQYDDAISSGHGAYLLEKDDDNVFSMSIGNLPPNQEVKMKIIYVTELVSSGTSNLQFTLPTTVLTGTRKLPENSNLHFQSTASEYLPYKLEVQLNIEMPSNIESIEIPTHPDLHAEISGCKATFAHDNVQMGRDLKVTIKLAEIKSHIWIESMPEGTVVDQYAVMMTIRPELVFKESQSEILFLVDRSGSMSGNPIARARETMYTALKHLPENCKFNIYGFGTLHTKLFSEARPCNLQTIYEAREEISKMEGDMGGTNLFGPLEEALNSTTGYPKKIFLLSDGAVDRSVVVCDLVRSKLDADDMLFTFAIGNGVDLALMEQLAELGKGTCTVIDQINNEFEKKVIDQVNRAIRPAFEEINLEWEDKKPTDVILQAPLKFPPIFNNQLYTIYALVTSPNWKFNGATITAKGNAGEQQFKLTNENSSHKTGLEIHRLAARCLIREMEEAGAEKISKEKAKKEIIHLSLRYNLASSYTSFLGVEKRKSTQTEGTMHLRNVVVPAASCSVPYNSNSRHQKISKLSVPMALTGSVSWRMYDIKYKKNEVFIDVVQTQNILISPTGQVIHSDVTDRIEMKAFLSGTPELKIGLDDRIKSAENLCFHQCVKLTKFEEEGLLNLIPPDGSFQLLNFANRDESSFHPLFIVVATIERFPHSKVEYHIRIKANYSASVHGKVTVKVPVPPDGCKDKLSVSPTKGEVTYKPEESAFYWTSNNFSGESQVVLTATFTLPSVESETPYKVPPIFVNYKISSHLPSMVKVKFLKVFEKGNYHVTRWIHYECSGQEEIRTKEILRV